MSRSVLVLVAVFVLVAQRPCLRAEELSVARLVGMMDGQTVETANEAYRQKDYDKALEGYRELLVHRLNPALLFNAGNAAFKAGKLGWAVAYWMRAHELAPRDPDIAANLDFARSLRADRAEEKADGLSPFLERCYGFLALSELQGLLVVLSWTAGLLLALWIFGRGPVLREFGLWAAGFVFVLLLVTGCWTVARSWDWERRAGAVVLAESVEAFSEPSAESTRVFVLHEGTDVKMRRESRGWVQVSLPNGFGGWVRRDALVEIASLGGSS